VLLGYNTNGFTSHSMEDALRVIAGLGYRSVGLTIDHHALDPFAPELDARVARCAALLRELGLVAVVETGARFLLDPWRKHWPTLLDADHGARERRVQFLTRAIDIAAAIGAPVVSLWSGSVAAGAPPEAPAALDDRLAAGLRWLCAHAAVHGVVIGFEPEPGMHVESMADFDRISAAVAHPAFQLTLDVGHAHLTEADGAEATVRRYAARIANVHLEGMARPTHDHLVPWEGDLDLLGVVRALRTLDYRGPATFELSRHSHAAVDTARRALAYVTPALR
jgi:sugar phosphate isomerase/epimerase